jgi:NitT/TauT family transport system substrate-binding protein
LLLLHQIPWQDNQIVDLPPSEEVNALAQGNIDAAVVWEPFARQMESELGKNGASWSAQCGQDFYWLLIGRDETIKKRPTEIRGLLAALASAEDFIRDHRDEAKKIVASQVGPKHMPELWETNGYTLSLSRPFLVAMEAEFRWMQTRQGVQEFKMPDLLDFIHFDALNSVRPEKIQMLH